MDNNTRYAEILEKNRIIIENFKKKENEIKTPISLNSYVEQPIESQAQPINEVKSSVVKKEEKDYESLEISFHKDVIEGERVYENDTIDDIDSFLNKNHISIKNSYTVDLNSIKQNMEDLQNTGFTGENNLFDDDSDIDKTRTTSLLNDLKSQTSLQINNPSLSTDDGFGAKEISDNLRTNVQKIKQPAEIVFEEEKQSNTNIIKQDIKINSNLIVDGLGEVIKENTSKVLGKDLREKGKVRYRSVVG